MELLFYFLSRARYCKTPKAHITQISRNRPLVALSLLEETLEVHALGALNREAESTVPDELGKGTQTTGDTKGGSVVESLVEAVVVEENTRAGVDVGVGVLGLAVLLEDLGGDAAVLLDELEDGVLGNLGASGGIVHESLEAGIGLAEDGVAVAGNNTARVEGGPEVVLDVLLAVGRRDVVLHLEDPAEDFLGGETTDKVVSKFFTMRINYGGSLPVKGTGKTLETGRVGKEGIAESGTNQVGGVGRDVAALVVTVESEVETEEVLEVLVLLATLAKHGSVVVGPILVEINLGRESTAAVVSVLVDLGGNGGQLSEQRDGVVKGRLPVVSLVEALLVGLGELGLVVEGRDGHGELGHGVEVLGEVVEHLGDKGGDLGLLGELTGELADLVGGGDLAGEEEPEHGLGKHLGARLALGEFLLAVLDGAAVEADTLVGVEDGAFPDHGLEAAHAAKGVFDLDLANDLVAVGLDLLEKLALGGNDLFEGGLEIGFGGGVGAGAGQSSTGSLCR